MKSSSKSLRAFSILFLAAALSACGGGGGGGGSSPVLSTPITLGGTTAVGSPIVNALVKVTCASGVSLTSQPTTITGTWQVTLTNQIFPCVAEVSGGTINNATNLTSYHSIASAAGVLNVTPLTDLIVANLAKTASVDLWFATLNSAVLTPIDLTAVKNASALVQTQLNLAQLGFTLDPLTTTFAPVAGSQMDDTLTALSTALTNSALTHLQLLTQASAGSTFTAPSGFATKMAIAFLSTDSGKSTSTPPSTPTVAPSANTTTGTAANGTPKVVVTNCAQFSTAQFGPVAGYPYMRCAANAVADFSVTLVDATDGKTCTATYNNGTLTVAKGPLTVTTLINSDLLDSLTTFGAGASETVKTVTGFSSNLLTGLSGLQTKMSSVTWDAAGALKTINGQIDGSANIASSLSCVQ